MYMVTKVNRSMRKKYTYQKRKIEEYKCYNWKVNRTFKPRYETIKIYRSSKLISILKTKKDSFVTSFNEQAMRWCRLCIKITQAKKDLISSCNRFSSFLFLIVSAKLFSSFCVGGKLEKLIRIMMMTAWR